MAEASPRARIAAACDRLGRDDVVRRCTAMLRGDEVDADFVLVVGGAAAHRLLLDGVPGGQDYWLRVWGVRGLLWCGPGDVEALRNALVDPSWRVREMVCKVVARHQVDDLLDDVSQLRGDPTRRVRDAARRATEAIVGAT